MLPPAEVEFAALDGTKLRGLLYVASKRGPGLVMTPGWNCLIQMLGLLDVAQGLQSAGVTVLLYDPRSTGLSDGLPRNDISPVKQTEDYQDALSFLNQHRMVNSEMLAIWGMSFSGAVALSAASLDHRVKAVIACCPLVEYAYDAKKLPMVLARCAEDRESQMRGNDPIYLPVLNAKGQNPAGFGIGADQEQFSKIVDAKLQIGPGHVNRTTIQSYARLASWNPSKTWQYLRRTSSTLFIVPELDRLCPMETQLKYLESLPGSTKAFIASGSGHMDVLGSKHISEIINIQKEFLMQVFGLDHE